MYTSLVELKARIASHAVGVQVSLESYILVLVWRRLLVFYVLRMKELKCENSSTNFSLSVLSD